MALTPAAITRVVENQRAATAAQVGKKRHESRHNVAEWRGHALAEGCRWDGIALRDCGEVHRQQLVIAQIDRGAADCCAQRRSRAALAKKRAWRPDLGIGGGPLPNP